MSKVKIKNNQLSVSDVDREIPILGSTNNAGNSINLVFGIFRLPSVGISRTAPETDERPTRDSSFLSDLISLRRTLATVHSMSINNNLKARK